ncbi:uncharacterized protein LAJ45_00069 [Morchella importuna]|nr:uncharacterized protein LAJ45_00069 [Morchella importuna]KAH8155060.1 hypothetical protein LAJ45_00069 [Morchella importuna]
MSEDKFGTWDFNHPAPTGLEERVQELAELRLPQDTSTDITSPLARFMTDNNPPRPLVGINNTAGYVTPHTSHLSIATSWGQRSIYDDYAPSAGSSRYEYPFSPSSTGSIDEQRFQGVSYDDQSSYSRRDSGGCTSPSSPGINANDPWRRHSDYSVESNTDINNSSPLGHHRLSQDASFVSLKNIQISPVEDENDDREDLIRRPHSNSIPGIYVNGHEHSDHGSASSWDMYQDYIPGPMDMSCSSPTSKVSPQASSPRTVAVLEARRERRRSRSGSTNSQLSNKARAELMKPHPDATTNANGKNHKGRGAGKKTKERQFCPEHPGKSFRHNSDFRKHMQTKHTRPFLCTFHFANCEQTFGSKNEWKRHVFSQHLQLHYWRCDYPNCADRKAYFNRKDLFGQHLKRMHGPKDTNSPKNASEINKRWLGHEIPQIQDRCRKERRAPPERSICGYCDEEFSGPGSWDARMEHVGKHYEKNNYKDIDTKTWVMDKGLIQWALEEKIVEKTEEGGYKLLCHGKDSIEGEERRRNSQYGPSTIDLGNEGYDDNEDAEGEYED